MRLLRLLTVFAPVSILCACGGPPSHIRATPTPPATSTVSLLHAPSATPAPSLDTTPATVYEDAVGSLRFLFEVTNLSEFPLERVRASVDLRAQGGTLLASQEAYAKVDLLHPGESAPVLVVFFLSNPDFASYEIRAEAARADYLLALMYPELEIADLSARVGEWVPYEVLGRVLNQGQSDAESVTVTATCVDSEGRIAAIISGSPEQRFIPAGESSEFLLSVGSTAAPIAECHARADGLIANSG
jgi:hypothetical protein